MDDHQTAIEYALEEEAARLQEGPAAEPDDRSEFPYDLSHDVSAGVTDRNNPERETLEVPHDGTLRRIILDAERGSANGVGVVIRTEAGVQFVPRNTNAGFFPVSSSPQEFAPNAELKAGELLVAEFVNFDTTNNHFVKVGLVLDE